MGRVIRLERHPQGPRVHVVGRRVHEYQLGFVLLAGAALAYLALSVAAPNGAAAAVGLWLVVKDWPDLFPSTRDQASWSPWIHRLPPRDQRPRRSASRA